MLNQHAMNKFTKLLLTFCFLISFNAVAQPFITKWNLSTQGSGPTQLTFGVGTTGSVSYTWETIPAGQNGSGTFNGSVATISGLPMGAMIRLSIDTTHFHGFNVFNGLDTARLVDVVQWGGVHWTTMHRAFEHCHNLTISATDVPDLSGVTSMNAMFKFCYALNGPANINSWNVSNITTMKMLFMGDKIFNQNLSAWNVSNVQIFDSMFCSAHAFNQPIGTWNVSSATSMESMFYIDSSFNQPIGNWNVSSVTNFRSMFEYATSFNQPLGIWNMQNALDLTKMFKHAISFNQPIGAWNTQNVTNMSYLFAFASSFNQPVGTWNTASVTNMNGVFNVAQAFNQPLNSWNTQSVTHMGYMFAGAISFNQPIGTWNTQNVTNLSYMFSGAVSFNQPIASWNTQSVTTMQTMFHGAVTFNQPIGNWNTQNVVYLSYMFQNATSFNQPLANWNINSAFDIRYMFSGATSFNQSLGNWVLPGNVILIGLLNNCGMDCLNYSATLNGWAANANVPYNRNLGALNLKYLLNAQGSRNVLINTKGWMINGDSLDTGICCTPQQGVSEVTACGSYFFNGQVLSSGGIYYDTLVSQSGCDSMLTMVLTINTVDTTVSQSGVLLSANAAGASYQWLRCNPYQAITGETNQNFTASANGSYAVAVTMNGCTDTSACYTVMGIGLDEYSNNDKIIIYPNPAKDKVNISSKFSTLQNTKKELYNTLGQLILTTYENEIDVSALVKGVYYVKCGRFVAKVIVE